MEQELRYELELMVAQAADRAVMRMLEKQPFVRPRSGEHVRLDDYVAVSALHTTARISANGRGFPDPQLHLHYLLMGYLDGAGQLRAMDSRVLANYQAELDAEAMGHLADLLQERGFEIEREVVRRRSGQPRVAWELKAVPRSLTEVMSSRSSEIEDLKRKFTEETGREAVGQAWDNWIVKQRGVGGTFIWARFRR